MTPLAELRSRLENRKGRRDQLLQGLEQARDRARDQRRLLRNLDRAQAVLQVVAQRTQQELEVQIGGLVTMALAAVFPDPYEFVLRFEQRRGKTEADLLFSRDGSEVHPLSASGGGVVDLAAFALRVALWRISSPALRPTIVLDEPFKHLSEDLQPKASALLKEVSSRLGVQFIMVTHSEELVESADRVFQVSLRRGMSRVTES
jgi:DNA repair exonuclease SbcCD ATPase subunit